MPDSYVTPSLQSHVSEAEWEARCELAAFYRVVSRRGWTDLTNNHITLKVPGTDGHFLLNPFGLAYDEVTASSLMKIDREGRIVLQPEHGYGINYTGFVIHGAIHEARPEIRCIAHTHTRAGIAVSSMQCGLLMFSQSALSLEGVVGYHDYEGISLDLDEQKRLAADLGPSNWVLILRNHGLIACGRSVAECFVNLYNLEAACRIQVDTLASGQKLIPLKPEAIAQARKVYDDYRTTPHVGRMEWAAEVRWLDRNSPDYRQ